MRDHDDDDYTDAEAEEIDAEELDRHQDHDDQVPDCVLCEEGRRQTAIDNAREFCADRLTTGELRMAMEGLPI